MKVLFFKQKETNISILLKNSKIRRHPKKPKFFGGNPFQVASKIIFAFITWKLNITKRENTRLIDPIIKIIQFVVS
jgi:hypothetical protein